MKKNEGLQNENHYILNCDPLPNSEENRGTSNFRNNLKKLFYVSSLACAALFINSCVAGYVATEPSYIVISRPPQPTNLHIWIDGGWRWNSQSHAYIQTSGYWQKPRPSQTFVSGHWQSSPQGKYWEKGRWQKQNFNNNNNRKGKNRK